MCIRNRIQCVIATSRDWSRTCAQGMELMCLLDVANATNS